MENSDFSKDNFHRGLFIIVAGLLIILPMVAFAETCHYELAGDVNRDCKVDFFDFAAIALNWLIDCNAMPEDPACIALDLDNDGYDVSVDCNDNDPNINPVAQELCDGIDNNCNGQIDEGCCCCADDDCDDYDTCNPGDPGDTDGLPADCDDFDAFVYPGASEVCDGIDNDCDGVIDDGVCTVYYADYDADGWGDGSDFQCLCLPSCPYTATVGGDCDDENYKIYPGAEEICGDAIDNNCDGQIDEGCCPPDGTPCNDGDDCTISDYYQDCTCAGTPIFCEEGFHCEFGICVPD